MFPFFERESPSLNEDLPKHPIKPHIDEVPVRTEEETYNDLTSIRFLRNDAAPGITVSPSGLTLRGAKGYRTVRASHGISAGDMYFEVRINEPVDDIPRVVNSDITSYIRPSALTQLDASSLFLPEPSRLSEEPHLITGHEGHIRIGYSTPQSPVCLPVGTTHGSFAYKGLDGSKGSYSVMEKYGEPYGPGDVVGCFIHLPHRRVKALLEDQPLPETSASPIVMSAAEMFVQTMMAAHGELGVQDIVIPPVMDEIPDSPLTFEDAFICFYKNGVCQGTAFHHLPQGLYLPAVSLYMYASVTVNFGPDFLYPPPELTFPRIVRVPSDGLHAGEECLPDDVKVTCEIEAIDRKVCSEIRKKEREKQLQEEHILQHGYNLHGMREPVLGRGAGSGKALVRTEEDDRDNGVAEARNKGGVKKEDQEAEQGQGKEKVLQIKQENSEEIFPPTGDTQSKKSMSSDDGCVTSVSAATRMTDTVVENQKNASGDHVVIPDVHSGNISVFPPVYQQDMATLRSRSGKSLGKILHNSDNSDISQHPEVISRIRALLSTRPVGHTWQLRLSRHFDTRYSCLYRSTLPNIQSTLRERKRAQIKKEQEKKRKSNSTRSRKKKTMKKEEEEEEGKGGDLVHLTTLSSTSSDPPSTDKSVSASSPSPLSSQPTQHTRRSGTRSEFKLEPVVSGPVMPAPVATLSLSAPVFSGQSSTTSSHDYTPIPTEPTHTHTGTEAGPQLQMQAHVTSSTALGLNVLHSFAPSPTSSSTEACLAATHSSSSSSLVSADTPSLAQRPALTHSGADTTAVAHSDYGNVGTMNDLGDMGSIGNLGIRADTQSENTTMTDNNNDSAATIPDASTTNSVDSPISPTSPFSSASPTSLSNALSTTSTTSHTPSLSIASTSSHSSAASHASTASNVTSASSARPSSRANSSANNINTSTSTGSQSSAGGPSLSLMPRVFPPWSNCVHKVLRWRLIGPQILVPNPRLATEGTYVYVANTEGPGEDLRVGIPKNIEIPDGKGSRKQKRECSRSAHGIIGTGISTGTVTALDDITTRSAPSFTRTDKDSNSSSSSIDGADNSQNSSDTQTLSVNASLGSEMPGTASLAALANMSGFCSVTGPSMQDIRIGISLVSPEIELIQENGDIGRGTRAVKCVERVIGITPPTAITASHVPIASTHTHYNKIASNTNADMNINRNSDSHLDTPTTISTNANPSDTTNMNSAPVPQKTTSTTDASTDTNSTPAPVTSNAATHISTNVATDTGIPANTSTSTTAADSGGGDMSITPSVAVGGFGASTGVGITAFEVNRASSIGVANCTVPAVVETDVSMNIDDSPADAIATAAGNALRAQTLPDGAVLGLPAVNASTDGEILLMMDDVDNDAIEHVTIGDNRNANVLIPSGGNEPSTMVDVDERHAVGPATISSETTEYVKSVPSHTSTQLYGMSQEANAVMNENISMHGDLPMPSPNTLNGEAQQGTNASVHVDGTISAESNTNK